jgi:3-methyladenine DNA glycosylase AlkD
MFHPSKAGVKRELARLARPAGAFDARRYFRGDVDLRFYNVGTKAIREMARRLYLANRDVWSIEQAQRFADGLIKDDYLEAKGVAIEVLALYRRQFAPRLLPSWKRWLARGYAANWATTDAICGYLIGPLLAAHPTLAPRVAAWARDRNLWVRRASAVSLIPLARRGHALGVAYAVAARLHADDEDLIQKAVGWMLREAGKADAVRLERYLRAHSRSIPRTTLRYAIERFDERKRRAILVETKGRRPGTRHSHGS